MGSAEQNEIHDNKCKATKIQGASKVPGLRKNEITFTSGNRFTPNFFKITRLSSCLVQNVIKFSNDSLYKMKHTIVCLQSLLLNYARKYCLLCIFLLKKWLLMSGGEMSGHH